MAALVAAVCVLDRVALAPDLEAAEVDEVAVPLEAAEELEAELEAALDEAAELAPLD